MHNCPNCYQDCDCSGDIDDIPVYTEAWVIKNCKCQCEEKLEELVYLEYEDELFSTDKAVWDIYFQEAPTPM
ncbi:hypothetical protein [Almyronema epifaneia]|uniref:Uncharacterized protein n=1 Tax=Almyronema epifaneia S1 TaxID=2991925 RepID=A0ABW6ILS8_9CYAN